MVDRRTDDIGLFKDFVHRTDIPQRTDIKTVSPKDKTVREQLHSEQNGKCNACALEGDPRHFHIGHIILKSKGGGDYYDNYQLLCGSCNSIKGDRPMQYLTSKIERIDALKNKLSF